MQSDHSHPTTYVGGLVRQYTKACVDWNQNSAHPSLSKPFCTEVDELVDPRVNLLPPIFKANTNLEDDARGIISIADTAKQTSCKCKVSFSCSDNRQMKHIENVQEHKRAVGKN